VSRRAKALGLGLAVLLAIGLVVYLDKARVRGAAAPTAAPAANAAIELAPGDLATATQAELSTQLVIHGGLRPCAAPTSRPRWRPKS
jgi:hypothetical protein